MAKWITRANFNLKSKMVCVGGKKLDWCGKTSRQLRFYSSFLKTSIVLSYCWLGISVTILAFRVFRPGRHQSLEPLNFQRKRPNWRATAAPRTLEPRVFTGLYRAN